MIFRTGDLQPENIESLALHAMVSLNLLPFAAQHWPRFYSFHGLMGLGNKKTKNEESAMVVTSAR